MKDETDNRDLMIVSSNSGLTRWAPLVVVFAVVGGFVTLSWYAYHAGIQSVKEEDLVVVEADKTPIKEKPTDPGGMQFPNQDKTVFETFSGNSKQPPKVERVLPVPEEPMAKDSEASGTTTWVNKDLKKSAAAEQVIGQENAKKPVDKTHILATVAAPDAKPTYGNKETSDPASQSEDEQSVSYVAPKKEASASETANNTMQVADNKPSQPFTPEKVSEAKPFASENETPDAAKEIPEKKPAPATKPQPKAAPATGSAMVQLGAYRSEAEANENWDKMHLKQKDLSDKEPLVIKADLGEKGVYYRLRVGGLSPAEAKALCKSLTAKGQACIVAADK